MTACYDIVRTPTGPLCAVVQDGKLIRLGWSRKPLVRGAPCNRKALLSVRRAIEEYMAGGKLGKVALLLPSSSPFQERVARVVSRIPYGKTMTYGEVARRAGSPGAARAVGQVMRHNPICLFIPCHRVVASGGRLGGFTGGISLKRRLLALESRRES